MRKSKSGFLMTASLIGVIILTLTVAALSVLFKSTWKEMVYIESMSDTYRLAEYGLNAAMKQLVSNPGLDTWDMGGAYVPEFKGSYSNVAYLRHTPIDPIFYVVTTATRTTGTHTYSTKLHAYVRVSNTSEYFAAVTDELVVSHPVDISQGKIYGSSLTFVIDGNIATLGQFKRAEYLNACYVQMTGGGAKVPWDSSYKNEIKISDPVSGDPVHLTASIIFPQVQQSDLDRYKAYAGPHTVTNHFSGDIYPPGYTSYSGANQGGDTYTLPGHTSDVKQHVYYYDGDIYVGGTVHGQVLMVASGNIHISSSIFCASDTFMITSEDMGSKANQLVLITKGNVFIDPTLTINTTAGTTETIQAMIIAPNGTIVPQAYPSAAENANLSLSFTGSMVLSTLNNSPHIPEVFQKSRTYAYMDSLRTTPPPYLPQISEIYAYMEQTGQSE